MTRWRLLFIVVAAVIGVVSAVGGNWWTFAGMLFCIASIVMGGRGRGQ